MKQFLLIICLISALMSYGQGSDIDSLSIYKKHKDAKAQCAKGQRYFNEQDYIKAKQYFELAANKSYPEALYMLGMTYLYGLKINQDYHQARTYYNLAAELGYTDAFVSIGYMDEKGLGDKIDMYSARKFYRKAAVMHNAVGLTNLGFHFRDGLGGLTKSDDSAFVYFKEAADSGYAKAELEIGYMYELGKGTKGDTLLAEKWYLKAAAQDNGIAACNLGNLYKKGLGPVQQSDSLTRKYFLKSASLGNARGQFQAGYMYQKGLYGEKIDTDKALIWYDASAQQHNGDALNNYAWICYIKRINLPRATRYSKESLDLLPGNMHRLDTYGSLLFLQDQFVEAEKYEKMSIDSGGYEKPDYLERYGDILIKLGRKDDAVIYWKKALALPDHHAILARKIELGQYVE